MSDELKPCPFCGAAVTRDQAEGMPDLVNHPDNGCVFVRPWAIKAEKWNTRADSEVAE